MTTETFGTEFMSLYLSYFPKPPSPLDYGNLKDKCKIIAARIELTSNTDIGNPGLKTFVVQETLLTPNGKSEKKEEGKSNSKDASFSSKDIAKAVEMGVAAAMKAMASKTMVMMDKGKQKEKPKQKDGPGAACKWCDRKHLFKMDKCWYNPSCASTNIPAELRAKVLKQREELIQKKKGAAGPSSSSITEMET
jgi:hypothetical protein